MNTLRRLKWLIYGMMIGAIIVLGTDRAFGSDDDIARLHCGPDAFSPRYEHCERFETHTVPEPSSLALFGAGLVVLVVKRSRA